MKKTLTLVVLATLFVGSVQISNAQFQQAGGFVKVGKVAVGFRETTVAPAPPPPAYYVAQPQPVVVVQPVVRIDMRNAITELLPPGVNAVVIDGVTIPAGSTVQLANRSVISVIGSAQDPNNPNVWVPIAYANPVEIVFSPQGGYERREYCTVGGTMAYFKTGECRKGGTFVKIAYN